MIDFPASMHHIQAVLRHPENGFYGKYIGEFYADRLENDVWRKLQASTANYVIVRTELTAPNIVRFNRGLPVYGEPLTAHAWVVSPEVRSEQHVELLQRWYLAGSPCSLDSQSGSCPDKVLRDSAGEEKFRLGCRCSPGFSGQWTSLRRKPSRSS